jgi:hypothetical protein
MHYCSFSFAIIWNGPRPRHGHGHWHGHGHGICTLIWMSDTGNKLHSISDIISDSSLSSRIRKVPPSDSVWYCSAQISDCVPICAFSTGLNYVVDAKWIIFSVPPMQRPRRRKNYPKDVKIGDVLEIKQHCWNARLSAEVPHTNEVRNRSKIIHPEVLCFKDLVVLTVLKNVITVQLRARISRQNVPTAWWP